MGRGNYTGAGRFCWMGKREPASSVIGIEPVPLDPLDHLSEVELTDARRLTYHRHLLVSKAGWSVVASQDPVGKPAIARPNPVRA
jgi:hypothetical protein